MKRIFTLSLVATMLAGMTMMSALEPAQAQSCNDSFNGNRGGRWNSASQLRFNNGRFNNGFNTRVLNNAFSNQWNNNDRALKRQIKQQRKVARQIRQQQLAAAGVPLGNGAFNGVYMNNVSNPCGLTGVNNGFVPNNASYNAGYNNGFNDAASGVGNGFINGNLNGNLGLGGIGLNNLGLNGLGYGNGVSSLLGQVLNRF